MKKRNSDASECLNKAKKYRLQLEQRLNMLEELHLEYSQSSSTKLKLLSSKDKVQKYSKDNCVLTLLQVRVVLNNLGRF